MRRLMVQLLVTNAIMSWYFIEVFERYRDVQGTSHKINIYQNLKMNW